MTHRFASSILLLVAAIAGCRAPSSAPVAPRAAPTTAAVIPLTAPVAEEISLEQLKLLLPRHPVVVGFDVDDTLLFTSPAFDALQPDYDPLVIRPKSYAALTAEQKAKFHEFWNRLNGEFDERSVPKEIGRKLLALHIARGDDIWIISRRQSIDPPPKVDVVTQRYERKFGVIFAHGVVQTQLKDKTPFIFDRKIEYYYGDSDSDITAAVAAGAVPIRVKRSPDSYAKDSVHNGQLGEIVLKDSER